MNLFVIGGVIAFLILILSVIYIFTMVNRKKTVSSKPKKKEKREKTFEELLAVLINDESSTSQLYEAAIEFNLRFHFDSENVNRYLFFLFKLLNHPHVDKTLFDLVHKEVKKNNTAFVNEIMKVELEALEGKKRD